MESGANTIECYHLLVKAGIFPIVGSVWVDVATIKWKWTEKKVHELNVQHVHHLLRFVYNSDCCKNGMQPEKKSAGIT